jgi:hypothetical protein
MQFKNEALQFSTDIGYGDCWWFSKSSIVHYWYVALDKVIVGIKHSFNGT